MKLELLIATKIFFGEQQDSIKNCGALCQKNVKIRKIFSAGIFGPESENVNIVPCPTSVGYYLPPWQMGIQA